MGGGRARQSRSAGTTSTIMMIAVVFGIGQVVLMITHFEVIGHFHASNNNDASKNPHIRGGAAGGVRGRGGVIEGVLGSMVTRVVVASRLEHDGAMKGGEGAGRTEVGTGDRAGALAANAANAPDAQHTSRLDEQATAVAPYDGAPSAEAAPVAEAVPAAPLDPAEDGWPEETIFVSMASYRDRECSKTVARALMRAAHPERISFGIFQQHNCSAGDSAVFPVPEVSDADGRRLDCLDCVANLGQRLGCKVGPTKAGKPPNHPACAHLWQVRVNRVHWLDTQGPTYARAMSERLYDGETYVLGIDSHTNFAQDWDNQIIAMYKRIPQNERAIITAYPASYSDGPEEKQASAEINTTPPRITTICRTRRVQVGRSIQFKHDMNSIPLPSRPIRVAFLAAGFNFGTPGFRLTPPTC